MRDQHFYASIDKAVADLNWTPKFSLIDGLKDSYEKVITQINKIKNEIRILDEAHLEKHLISLLTT